MRLYNNYSNSYNSKTRINEIRGLSNEYGINLNGCKEEYNEEKIIKSRCKDRNSKIKKG
ncbi:MAG: hypothetical protein HFI49_01450 [Bacilli bacterium]|jgi:hypothetical protein|nr:hypothetical protein [Bacilli bacterium]